MVSDGRQSDVTRITVAVINVNEHDPILSQNNYVFHVSESRLRNNSVIGEIHASDADDGDVVHLSLKGPHAGMFAISNEGRLRVRNLKTLNTTECHIVVVATDSGSPPRSASASVLVHFSPQILKNFGRNIDLDQANLPAVDVNMLSQSGFFNPSSSSAIILVIVLGVLLGTLFIIIIALTVHVLKHRKYVSSNPSSHSSYSSSVNHNINSLQNSSSRRNIPSLTSLKNNKIGAMPDTTINTNVSPLASRGVENPIFNMPANRAAITRIDPDSAVVSDASSNETVISSGERTDLIRNIPSSLGSNSPPPPPNITGTASRISVIRWPQGSIPRRVKKLTWEDEQREFEHHYSSSIAIRPDSSANHISSHSDNNNAVQRQTELDPDVSVIPLRRTIHSTGHGLPDLTVYF